MVCINSCVLGFALVGGMIFCMLASHTSSVFVEFQNLLNNEQKRIYTNIVKERAQQYLIGFFIGLLLAYLFIINTDYQGLPKVCIFVTIALAINILYYKIMPKSKYMLEYLNTSDQNKAWLKIYKHMKFRYMTGMVLGALGYLFLANGLC